MTTAKMKQAAMTTPLMLSSRIAFWVGIQAQASYEVMTRDLAWTGSFDCHVFVKLSHFLYSDSFLLNRSVVLMFD
jgi:hypothetical protein